MHTPGVDEPGYPLNRFIAEARALCRAAACPKCGRKGLLFDHQYIREPYSLRFFEKCSGCHHTDEF